MKKEYKSLILRCVLCENRNDRIKYAEKLISELETEQKRIYKTVDGIIEKLVIASKQLKNQKDWISYLYKAMGKHKYSICHKAKIIKNKKGV